MVYSTDVMLKGKLYELELATLLDELLELLEETEELDEPEDELSDELLDELREELLLDSVDEPAELSRLSPLRMTS